MLFDNQTKQVISSGQEKQKKAVSRQPAHVERIAGDKKNHTPQRAGREPVSRKDDRQEDQITKAAKDHIAVAKKAVHQDSMLAVLNIDYL